MLTDLKDRVLNVIHFNIHLKPTKKLNFEYRNRSEVSLFFDFRHSDSDFFSSYHAHESSLSMLTDLKDRVPNVITQYSL